MIVAPRIITQVPDSGNGLECSLHTLPKPLLREFRHVFGDKYLMENATAAPGAERVLLAIPTNQHAREDLVATGDHIEAEKDRLLNVVSSVLLCSGHGWCCGWCPGLVSGPGPFCLSDGMLS